MSACGVDGCNNPLLKYRKYCRAHTRRLYRYGDPTYHPPKKEKVITYCGIEGCSKEVRYRGLCKTHYSTRRNNLTVEEASLKFGCSQNECNFYIYQNELCKKHYTIIIKKSKFDEKTPLKCLKPKKGCKSKDCSFLHFAHGWCRRHYLSEEKNTLQEKYKTSKRQAYSRKLNFTLTIEQYIELSKLNCFYCDHEVKSKSSGLDRIDNSKGYHIDNVVRCCSFCNYIRGNLLTTEETKSIVNLLKKLRKKDNIWEGFVRITTSKYRD